MEDLSPVRFTRKQHFLSQFYLRYFASDAKREKVWCYDTRLQRLNEEPIASIAFYPKKSGWTQQIEDSMGKIESDAKTIIDSMTEVCQHFATKKPYLRSGELLDINKYRGFVEFVGLQLKRSMTQDSFLRQRHWKGIEEHNYTLHGILEGGTELSPDEKKQLYSDFSLTPKRIRTYMIERQMTDCFSKPEIRYLLGKTLHICYLDIKNRSFVTSDHPFFMMPDEEGRTGTSYPNSSLWFVLAPKLCVRFQGPHQERENHILWNIIKPPPTWIEEVNRRLCLGTHRYIFSNNEKLATKLWKWHKDLGDNLATSQPGEQ